MNRKLKLDQNWFETFYTMSRALTVVILIEIKIPPHFTLNHSDVSLTNITYPNFAAQYDRVADLFERTELS